MLREADRLPESDAVGGERGGDKADHFVRRGVLAGVRLQAAVERNRRQGHILLLRGGEFSFNTYVKSFVSDMVGAVPYFRPVSPTKSGTCSYLR
jgi:hypothetical protein